MYTTTDDTIPAAAGTCPPWCTDPDPHPWLPDGGGWSRMHQATIGVWAVAQMVYVNEDGTLDRMPPVVDCNLSHFDTVEDGEAVLAELRRAIEVLGEALEGGA